MPEDGRPGSSFVEPTTGRGRGSGDSRGDRSPPATVPLDVPALSVSLAVEVLDWHTGSPTSPPVDVSLDGIETERRWKADRFVLFVDASFPEPPTPVVVVVDGDERYSDVTREVVVSDREDLSVPPSVTVIPESDRTLTVELFPVGETIVDGVVRDDDGNSMEGATVSTSDQSGTTDSDGRFVLTFAEPPDGETVSVEVSHPAMNRSRSTNLPVKTSGSTTLTIVVRLPSGTLTVETEGN